MAAPLTSDQLTTLRRQYLRDEFVQASGPTPRSALSRYNQANSANYFKDSDLLEIDQRVWALYETELDGIWSDAHGDRLAAGDDVATATSKADAVQLDARYRLIRAEAWTMMIADPAFRASLMVGSDSSSMTALLSAWSQQIEADRSAASPESTGGVVSIPLSRR